MTWRDLFPDGRLIFYEGNDPEGFANEIKAKFSFDPRKRTLAFGSMQQDEVLNESWCEEGGWAFWCPPDILNNIYGTSAYPMGS